MIPAYHHDRKSATFGCQMGADEIRSKPLAPPQKPKSPSVKPPRNDISDAALDNYNPRKIQSQKIWCREVFLLFLALERRRRRRRIRGKRRDQISRKKGIKSV